MASDAAAHGVRGGSAWRQRWQRMASEVAAHGVRGGSARRQQEGKAKGWAGAAARQPRMHVDSQRAAPNARAHARGGARTQRCGACGAARAVRRVRCGACGAA
eukprot:6740992-Prymnesium_polylepis.1